MDTQNCLLYAELGISKLPTSLYFLNGMSSPKVRRLLNILCGRHGTRYLEIGSWRGSTLVSAAYGNQKTLVDCLAIDNFAEFEKPLIVNPLIQTLSREYQDIFLHMMNNTPETEARYWLDYFDLNGFVELINADCFSETAAQAIGDRRFNVYFYDGNHSYLSQYDGIAMFLRYMEDEFVLIVDDFNDKNAEAGTRDALRDLHVNVKNEWVLPARHNGDVLQWWQGLYVAEIKK